MHGHHKSGFDMGQAHHADRAQGLAIQEPDLELALGVGQHHAHIAVENAQLRVVAGDHDRTPGKPFARDFEQTVVRQGFLHSGIEFLGAPVALMHRTQNAKTLESLEHAAHPSGVRFSAMPCGPLLHETQVMGVRRFFRCAKRQSANGLRV